MKIQCDACEKAQATVICCADEAALCASCDVEIHAANKLASKHQRLQLDCLSNKLPRCDICQEKPAFIFCVEDRALFCQDCDEPIHVPGTLSGNHHRFLATGIRIATEAICNNKDTSKGYFEPPFEPPSDNSLPLVPIVPTTHQAPSAFTPVALAVEEFLQMSDPESCDKRESSVGFGELDWFADIGLFHEQAHKRALEAIEVPEIFGSSPANTAAFYKPTKASMPLKKPRTEIADDDEYFTVPDLG
ncbi:B-box zinc finger protein 24-like [Iris pallida]|uniref:B-box zinc finger protein 24-like n=1 Tax=Iris pallida TaxID=29817 RepID=A0AAX6EP40_IRIPA|nr:B-box zinc finger protein 24-like [Iris pallida]QZU26832.1 BBX5 protein [Iris germanica]